MILQRKRLLISVLTLLFVLNAGYYSVVLYNKFQQYKKQMRLNPGQTNIFINTIPKSASDHVADTIQDMLRYNRDNLTRGHFPEEYVYPEVLALAQPDRKWVFKQHLAATDVNINIYRGLTNKIVLHLRDPRQVILSWVHHLDKDPQPDRPLPEGYYTLSFEQKLDWNIDHNLPVMVKYIQDWLALKEVEDQNPNGLRILVTTYDEILQDEVALYKKILKFYKLSKYALDNYRPKPKQESRHFRKGDPNEWRVVFNAEQKQRMATMVPTELLKRFNWELSYD